MEALPEWRWTSVTALVNAGERPRWFSREMALGHAGDLKDTAAGRKRYLDYLAWLQEDEPGKKALQSERLSKDSAVGTRESRKDRLKAHKDLNASLPRGEPGARELAEEMWSTRMAARLPAVGKTARDVRSDAKGAPWKVATTASNPWLARRLNMRSPYRSSRIVSACRRETTPFQPNVDATAKCKLTPLVHWKGRKRIRTRPAGHRSFPDSRIASFRPCGNLSAVSS